METILNKSISRYKCQAICGSNLKTRYNILFIATIIIFAFHSTARASTVISASPALEALINEALENNHELKSIKKTVESLNEKETFQGTLSDPKIGFALLNLPSDGLSLTQEGMTQKQAFIAQKLPWPGKLKLKALKVSLTSDKLSSTLKYRQLQTAQKIAESYYDLGFVTESLKLNQSLTELMQNILNVASAKYSSGQSRQRDIFKIQVELSLLSDEKIQLTKKHRVTEDKINALLNRDDYSKIDYPENSESIKINAEKKKFYKEKALKNNPTLKALKIETEKNRAITKLAQKGKYPDFDVKLSYGQRDEDNSGRKRDDFLSLSTSFNIPLWKHKKQDKEVLSGKAAERAAINKYKNFAKTLPHLVDAVFVEIDETIKSYKLYKDRLIPQSIKLAQSAASDYEVGKTGFSTMVNAKIQPLKFQLKEKKYLFEVLKKQAELEVLTGGL